MATIKTPINVKKIVTDVSVEVVEKEVTSDSGASGAVVSQASEVTQTVTDNETIVAVTQEKEKNDLGFQLSDSVEKSIRSLEVSDPAAAAFLKQIKNYVEQAHRNKSATDLKIRELQRDLYRTLLDLPVYASLGFNQAWGTLLAIVNENKGANQAFNEINVFRYMHDDSVLQVEDRIVFTRLINLLLVTSDPSIRKFSAKHVSMNDTLKTGFTDDAANKIRGYYAMISQ